MSLSNLRILIIEDDPHLALLVRTNLEMDGFHVKVCTEGNAGLEAFKHEPFNLCLIDVMLPKKDGFSVATELRKRSQIPIIFITAKALKEDVYKGFELGGDDYITKPFTIRELQLRIAAVLKRCNVSRTRGEESYFIGSLIFDYNLRQLTGNGITQNLSTKENELLRLFCENVNVVIARKRLLVQVWGSDDYFVSKSLDVYITRLRKLLSCDPRLTLQNHHSVGFKLVEANH